MPVQPQRVIVIGSSCCGKTTFAKRLAQSRELPRVELDALYWGPNWQATPADEFRRLVADAVSQDRWIVDGNYGLVRDILWPHATHVVWLNYSFVTVFRRALKRTLRRSFTREKLYADNRESFARSFLSRDSILWWVITTFNRRRRSYRALFENNIYPQLTWIELRKPVAAERFLQTLTADLPSVL